MSDKRLTKDFPAVRAAGRSAKASLAATRLHLEHKMQAEITALRAALDQERADNAKLRAFAQAIDKSIRPGFPIWCDISRMLEDHGLNERPERGHALGKPTALLSGRETKESPH